MMKKVKALSLFSGGLDSILATRLIMAQGIEVEAVQFVTPFFHYEILEDIEQHRKKTEKMYGINVRVVDISDNYLRLLHHPLHGFGKNFNPCIDCKIMMFQRAKQMLAERGASFLISGEVLGQRPMSQRRDTLNLIERDSGVRSILLRPLSAHLMQETLPEIEGWVDRSKLLRMSGRGRSAQIALAREFGITDYPAPAGGCTLADPILSKRIARLYTEDRTLSPFSITVPDIRTLLIGRQFLLPGGGWLVLGRDERDNDRLELLAQPDDALLYMEEWPGPAALLKKISTAFPEPEGLQEALLLCASLVVRYGKKLPAGQSEGEVSCFINGKRTVLNTPAFSGEAFRSWIME
jgi:hypothetical protein